MARTFIDADSIAYAGSQLSSFAELGDGTPYLPEDGIEFQNTGNGKKFILSVNYDGSNSDASAVIQIPYVVENRHEVDDRVVSIPADGETYLLTEFTPSFYNQSSDTGESGSRYVLIDFYEDGALVAGGHTSTWTIGVIGIP